MVVTHEFTMTLDRRGVTPLVDAVQGDANTRAVKVTLTVGGVPFTPPAGAVASVAFRKPDGKKGWYDKLPDGSAACTTEGNTVTAILAPEVLTVAGQVEAVIILQDADLDQLATFEFTVQVAKNLAAGITVSNDYYSYSTMEQVSAALDGFFAQAEKEQTAFEEKIGKEQAAFLKTASDALDAVHTAAGENGPAIVCEETGSVITANDASNRLLQGLTLYGKTTQNGTPTPENPVELVSAGNGGAINTTVAGKNLYDMSANNDGYTLHSNLGSLFANASYSASDFIAVDANTKYTFSTNGSLAPTWLLSIVCFYNREKEFISKLNPNTSTFTTPSDTAYLRFSTSTVRMEGSEGYIQLEKGATATAYEPYKGQTITASTPNGLPGIPVTSGGNYTDAAGQQWICDEMDFARGVYIQRVMIKTFNGTENWAKCNVANGWFDATYWLTVRSTHIAGYNPSDNYCLSNQYKATSRNNIQSVASGWCALGSHGCEVLFTTDLKTVEEWKAELAQKYAEGNPVKIAFVFSDPIETPLSAEELAQYSALHTNKPNISAYNDAGVGMKLAYVADTKLYIDKKFNELAAAIVNNA